MKKLNLLAVGALSLGLAATAFASHAQPYGKGGNYVVVPAARAQAHAEQGPGMRMAKCDCSAMKGDVAMRDQCMAMMGDQHDETSKPGQPG